MAPVATDSVNAAPEPTNAERVEALKNENQVFNPFYSPSIGDDGDDNYEFAQFKVCFQPCFLLHRSLIRPSPFQPSFPKLSWEPLKEVAFSDRGLVADPAKKNLLGAAQKVRHLTPAIGTELLGIDLRQLSDTQKDELYVACLPSDAISDSVVVELCSSRNAELCVGISLVRMGIFNQVSF